MSAHAIKVGAALCLLAASVLAVGCGMDPLGYKAPKADEGKVTDQILEEQSPSITTGGDTVMMYEGDPVLIWKAGNDGAIEGMGGTSPVVFQDQSYYVTEVTTYHSDNAGEYMGPAGTISLEAENGTVYGPWQAEIYNRVYWRAVPEEVLPAGNYTLIDSNPATWAQNQGTGMGWALGFPSE